MEINVNYRECPPRFPPQSKGLDRSLSSLQSDAFFTIKLFGCNQNYSLGGGKEDLIGWVKL